MRALTLRCAVCGLIFLLGLYGCGGEGDPEVDADVPMDANVVDAGHDATVAIDAAGTVAPTVIATSPVDAATEADPELAIEATFSANMAADTLDATTFRVTRNGEPIAGTVNYTASSRVATFRPAAGLTLLGVYTATITTAVTDLGGTPLAADHSFGFTVRDGTWGTAELIEFDNTGHASLPRVVFDTLGNATAAWEQLYDGGYRIWANRYDADEGWGTATLIDLGITESTNVELAVDPAGIVTAVWSGSDMWSNRYVPGTGWGTATPIVAGGDGAAYVAVDPSGNVTAVYYRFSGGRYSIAANRYVPGTGWGTSMLLESDDAGEAFNPDLAVDPMGNVTAVWDQSDGSRTNIWATRYQPGFGWALPVLLETGTGNAFEAEVAVDPLGHATAVWRQHNGTRFNAWSNRYTPGTGWDTAVQIETDEGASGYTRVAVDPSGFVTAVWWDLPFHIRSNRFSPGSGWGTATRIDNGTLYSGSPVSPGVAVDESGNAIATWVQYDGTRDNVWSSRFSGGVWGTPVLLETDNIADARDPQVAVDPSGRALAVWAQYDASRANIWASAFR